MLTVDSPFDYPNHAALYVPQAFAAAGSAQHSQQTAQLVLDAAQRIGGRTLVLTTTLRALQAISESLRTALGLFADLDVLVQERRPNWLWSRDSRQLVRHARSVAPFWWLRPRSGRGGPAR